MGLELLQLEFGKDYRIENKKGEIYLYYKDFEYEPVAIVREDGIYGYERNREFYGANLGNLRLNAIAYAIRFGNNSRTTSELCRKIYEKIINTKDEGELNALLLSPDFLEIFSRNNRSNIENQIIEKTIAGQTYLCSRKGNKEYVMTGNRKNSKYHYADLLTSILQKEYFNEFLSKYDIKLQDEEYLKILTYYTFYRTRSLKIKQHA